MIPGVGVRLGSVVGTGRIGEVPGGDLGEGSGDIERGGGEEVVRSGLGRRGSGRRRGGVRGAGFLGGEEAEVAEDFVDGVFFGDDRDNFHLGAAARAEERIDLVDLGDEAGPGAAGVDRGLVAVGRGVLLFRRVGLE